jgi:hypothetical protein
VGVEKLGFLPSGDVEVDPIPFNVGTGQLLERQIGQKLFVPGES